MGITAIKPIRKVIDFPHTVKNVCVKCHREINEEAAFCPWCGKKQNVPRKPKYQPKKKSEVYPLKDIDGVSSDEWIDRMQECLLKRGKGIRCRTNQRNYIMFTVGIDIGLRANDLVRLKTSDFLHHNWLPKKQTRVIEQKTGKARDIYFNDGLVEAVREYIVSSHFKYDDYIFPSNKKDTDGNVKPMEIDTWSDILQDAAKEIGYPLNVGARTVRKTFGYRIYMTALNESEKMAQRALAILCGLFNHSSTSVTLKYIGIDEQEKIDLISKTASDYSRYMELEDEDKE